MMRNFLLFLILIINELWMLLRTVSASDFLFAATVDANFAAPKLKQVSYEKNFFNGCLLPRYAWGIS